MHQVLYLLVRDVFLSIQLQQDLLSRCYHVLFRVVLSSSWRRMLVFQHIKRYVVSVGRVISEDVELLLCILEPLQGILYQSARDVSNDLELRLNMMNVLLQYRVSLLLLNFKRSFNFFEFVSDTLPQLLTLLLKLFVQHFNVLFVSLKRLVGLNQVVYFNETLCPHFDLSQDISLHPDVVILVVSKQGTA